MKSTPWNMVRFGMSSPWLLAAAAGLLIVIVTTFALHNYRLENRLMLNAMLQKASTLMRVLQSGTRSSYLADLRSGRWSSSDWSTHAQRVIDHLSEDFEIRYMAVTNDRGEVIVHTDTSRIGSRIKLPTIPPDSTVVNAGNLIVFAVNQTREKGRVFEAVRFFVPYQPLLPRLPKMKPDELLKEFLLPGLGMQQDLEAESSAMAAGNGKYYVLVGLDMKEFDRTMGRLKFQIVMLSLAMLLVGLGGWFSLSAVQHYRLSQQALSNIQAFTALLVDRIPVGIIATDQGGRVATWNHAIEGITGIGGGKAAGRAPADLLPAQLADFFIADGGSPREDQVREVSLKIGARALVLLCHCLDILDREDRYQGQVLLISDVSDVRTLERKMREQERLAAIGRMAGGVAHEIRNPLSSVKGLAVLLRDKFGKTTSEGRTAALIVSEVDRMNRTIADILSLTRPGTHESKPTDISGLLERSRLLVEPEARARGVEIELEVAPDLPLVQIDGDRFSQVLLNLLLNGIQAMDDGGRLSLQAAADSGKLTVRISDTGCGMDEETLGQIFYPYFTTKKHGTGLGLALSQKIMLDHGGAIRVESQPDAGTTVILELPVVA